MSTFIYIKNPIIVANFGEGILKGYWELVVICDTGLVYA